MRNLIVSPSRLSGTIAVPGSKSHTIRAVAMAMMADGKSVIHAPLVSEDTLAAVRASGAFGAPVDRGNDAFWMVPGRAGNPNPPGEKPVDMANSGTSIKIFAALAALASSPVAFDGDSSLRSRPMGPLLDALTQGGVKTVSANGKCPFSVQGPFRGGGRITVNGKSSQYVTAMLFAAAFARGGDTRIDVVDVNEQPYIGITLAWMDRLGLKYSAAADYSRFDVPGGQSISGFEAAIPADFSTAAFPLVAAAVANSKISIRNLDFSDSQGDKAVFGFLERMGATVERSGRDTFVSAENGLVSVELDLNATPDALPAVAVAAAFAKGTTLIRNVAQARIKETDRIACMTRELGKMGVHVTEFPDGMAVEGGKTRPRGTVVESYGDHRIAMALAVAGLAAEGETTVLNAECAAVTYPAFFEDFRKLGARFQTV